MALLLEQFLHTNSFYAAGGRRRSKWFSESFGPKVVFSSDRLCRPQWHILGWPALGPLQRSFSEHRKSSFIGALREEGRLQTRPEKRGSRISKCGLLSVEFCPEGPHHLTDLDLSFGFPQVPGFKIK